MPQSRGERRLEELFRTLCLPPAQTEFRFDRDREWRFDFAFPRQLVAVELEGHPSHRTTRFRADCEKYSHATILGWRLIRLTPEMIGDGTAARILRLAFQKFGAVSTTEQPPAAFTRASDEKEIQTMPTATPSAKHDPIPPGDHILTLVCVEEKDQPDFNDSSKMVTRWIWQFKSQMKNPNTGERFEFRQYTGTAYGNSKAGLTILLDQICPKLSEDEKATIDTDTLLNKSFNAKIRHEKAEKAGDPPRPRLAFIEPYRKPAKPAPEPEPDEDDSDIDPFANE